MMMPGNKTDDYIIKYQLLSIYFGSRSYNKNASNRFFSENFFVYLKKSNFIIPFVITILSSYSI